MKRNKHDIIFFIVLAILFILYIFRAQYGFVSVDESLYLALPYRFLTNDAMLSEEWNLSQLSAILLLPLVKGYLAIFKNTDMMYLAFRYIYIIWNLAVTIISFIMLKNSKYHKFSYVIPLKYFCFIPYRIMALNYNSMLLSFFYLIAIYLIKDDKKIIDYVVMGILYACGVLCNPYIIVIYLVFILVVLFKLKQNDKLFNIKNAGYMTLGSFLVFVLFIYMILRNNSLNDIIINVEMMLNDPTHGYALSDILAMIGEYIKSYKIVYAGWFVLFILTFIKKYRPFIIKLSVGYVGLLTIYMTLFKSAGLGYEGIGVNAVMLHLSLVGLQLLLTREIKNRDICVMYIFGLFYSILATIASNQGAFIFSVGATIMSIASVFALADYFESKMDHNILKEMVVIQVLCEIFVLFNGAFFDSSLRHLQYVIEDGSFKGIKTTQENKEAYEIILKDIKSIDAKDKRCLFFKNLPYAYLETNSLVGSYSVWNQTDRLDSIMYESYYLLHPDMVPKVIYVEKDVVISDGSDVYIEYASEKGYDTVMLESGAMLLERGNYD